MEDIFCHEIRLDPAKAALKQPVCFIQHGGCPALGALMVYQEVDRWPPLAFEEESELFTTFIAEHGIRNVFCAAAFTELGFVFIFS